MKRLLGAALLAVAVLSSCGSKKKSASIEDNIPEHDFISEVVIPAAAQAAKAKPAAKSVSVVMLWEPNGALWAEDANGIMQWGKYDVPTGTELEGICSDDGVIEKKTAKRNSNGNLEERVFVHVKYEEKDLWVQEGMVAVDAHTAVVAAENTLVYNTPTITGMGSKVLDIGTVVAVSSEEVSDKNFVKIDASLTTDYIRGKYIKADKIVTNSDDVQVLQLLTLAKKSKNETVRGELLINAKTLKPSDTVAKMLNDYEAELNKTYTEKAFETPRVMQIEKDSDVINVKNAPGVKGEVVLQLHDGDMLQAVGSTEEKDVIDGVESAWLHIKELKANDDKGGFSETGKEGWVFQQDLQNSKIISLEDI